MRPHLTSLKVDKRTITGHTENMTGNGLVMDIKRVQARTCGDAVSHVSGVVGPA